MTLSLIKPKRQNLLRPRFIWTDMVWVQILKSCLKTTLHTSKCLIASQTVISTVEENNRYKSFTVNDETTGGTLRLRVPTEKRYEAI